MCSSYFKLHFELWYDRVIVNLLQTLEKQKVYTDEELAEFERYYDELRRENEAKQVIYPSGFIGMS